jgi:hypothetical protein
VRVTEGQRHEAPVLEALLEQPAVTRGRRGRRRKRPKRVGADKGYSRQRIRAYLRRRGIRGTRPWRSNERRGRFDPTIYRTRNQGGKAD